MNVYEPAEDSHLMKQCLPSNLQGRKVLEIGCGSGFLSVEAARRGGEVIAVDINPLAVKATRKAAIDAKVTVVACEGDMFEPVTDEQFDLVICNPPYLPNEPKDPDIALDGGPEGWEYIEKFLQDVSLVLKKEGKVLLLFSSHSKPDKIAEIIHKNKFTSKLIGKKEVGFFEELFVVELTHHD